MKFIPILFSTPMVNAILNGKKTQTRRIIDADLNNHYLPDCKGKITYFQDAWGCPECGLHHATNSLKCRYGEPGDVLWVRETWQWEGDTSYKDAVPVGHWWYKADEGRIWNNGPSKWKPSIFMPKEACRIFLAITDIRVERLKDISEEDAKAEGIEVAGNTKRAFRNYGYKFTGIFSCDSTNKGTSWYDDPKAFFFSLWESINGKESLDANPWVWVIKFRRMQYNGEIDGTFMNKFLGKK